MTHETILQKKEERLAKYAGGKLRRKQKALEKARARVSNRPTVESLPAFKLASEPPKEVPELNQMPVKETRPVKDEAPEWQVVFSDGKTLTVRATSEKKARTAAREVEGLPRLPAGTKVERVSS